MIRTHLTVALQEVIKEYELPSFDTPTAASGIEVVFKKRL